MSELIPILNQGADFLVDSRDVAKLFGLTHKHLREQIEEHQPEIERLGVYRFETAKPAKVLPILGGRPEKYFWLNFDQTIFLLTLTRPTEETTEYRVRLILAFRSAQASRGTARAEWHGAVRQVRLVADGLGESWRGAAGTQR